MLTMAMLHDAQRVLSGVINKTPVIPSTGITQDCRLFLKADSCRRPARSSCGAHTTRSPRCRTRRKRGALSPAPPETMPRAWRLPPATWASMPSSASPGAPLSKIEATRSYGAEVVLVPGVYDDAYAEAIRLRDEKGYTFIHPFDDYSIMAGQGTIGLEILQQLPDVDVIITAIGGGGLISGVAKAVKELKPSCQVIGVQAEGAASMYEALRQDKIITLPQVGTMADGIQVKTAGTLTFDMCRQYVDKVITVSESEIAAAILTILEKQKLITEGAGAVSVAAVMSGKLDLKGKTVCALLSGGNVDVTMLERIIKHGLTAEGRIASFSTVLPDQPNALATYLAALSHEGVNVLEVYHERSSMKVGVGSCRVRMVVETRNHEHIRQLYSYLAEQGYTIKE